MSNTINSKRLLLIITAIVIVLLLFSFAIVQNAKAEEQSYIVNGTETTVNISAPKVKERENSTNWYIAKKNYYKDLPDISLAFNYPDDFSSIPSSEINNCFKIYNSESFSNDSIVGELNATEMSIQKGRIEISLSSDKIKESGIQFEELKTYYVVIDPFFGSTKYGSNHRIVIEFIYYLPNIQYPDVQESYAIEPGESFNFKIHIEDDEIDMVQLYDDLSFNSFGDSKVAKVYHTGFTFQSNHSMDINCCADGYSVGGQVFLVRQASNGRLIAEIHINVQNVNYRTKCIDSPIEFTYFTNSEASTLNFDGYTGSYDIVNSYTEYNEEMQLYKQYIVLKFDTVAENFSMEVKDASQIPVVYFHITTEDHVYDDWRMESDATCKSVSVYGRDCTKCGYHQVRYGETFGPHAWNSEYTVDKKAGHTESGIMSIHCTVCDQIKSGSEVEIPAEGHSREVVKGYSATCTKNGLTDGEKCSKCGVILKTQEDIPALGHEFINGKCIHCGDTDPDYKPAPVEPISKFTGLADSADKDGNWWFFKDGKIDKTHNGVDQNKYGWWRVENGKVNFNAQGIYQNSMGWWKTTNGKVTFKEEGVFQNEYGWWRVKDSKVDFNAQSIYQNQFGWWKTTNGKVTFKENGLFKNQYGTWKVENSKVNFGFNGKYQGKTIKNGKVV